MAEELETPPPMEELAVLVVQLVLETPPPIDELETAPPVLLETAPLYEHEIVTVPGEQVALAVTVVWPPASVDVKVR